MAGGMNGASCGFVLPSATRRVVGKVGEEMVGEKDDRVSGSKGRWRRKLEQD